MFLTPPPTPKKTCHDVNDILAKTLNPTSKTSTTKKGGKKVVSTTEMLAKGS